MNKSTVGTLAGAAIVLAAGFSQRFGSDKRKVDVRGTPLLRKTLDTYVQVFECVYAVVRTDDETDGLISPECNVVRTDNARQGMAHSLAAGIAATSEKDWVVIGLGDMPDVQSSTLIALRSGLEAGEAIVRPKHNGQPGHPVGFAAEFFEELLQLKGDVGARAVLCEHTNAIEYLEVEDQGVLLDIDTLADLDLSSETGT